MVTSDLDPETPWIRVSVRPVPSSGYDSPSALARAFGKPMLVPSWWPPDVPEISYSLTTTAAGASYRIGSHRDDGSPILVVGLSEDTWAGRSPEDCLNGGWTHPPDLAQVRGLIGRVGSPLSLQAVIYDAGLAVQLIGYRTEDEVRNSVGSLQRIAAS
jgi:hypothetical protein